MKVLLINDYDYYEYPKDIKSLEEFVTYANTHMGRLVPMVQLRENLCCHPFYIQEEKRVCYMNPSRIETVTEEEVTVLTKKEYTRRLQMLMNTICVNCIYYEDELENDAEEIRGKMCLNGKCWEYEAADNMDNDMF